VQLEKLILGGESSKKVNPIPVSMVPKNSLVEEVNQSIEEGGLNSNGFSPGSTTNLI